MIKIAERDTFVSISDGDQLNEGYFNGIGQQKVYLTSGDFANFTGCVFATRTGEEALSIYFGPGSTEKAYANVILPEAFGADKNIKFILYWSEVTGNTGNCYWKITYDGVPQTDNAALNEEAGDTGTDLLDGGKNSNSKIAIISHTTTSKTFNPGDLIQIRLERLGAEGTDTHTGDCAFLGLVIEAA